MQKSGSVKISNPQFTGVAIDWPAYPIITKVHYRPT